MVDNIRRGMLAGQQMMANKQPSWREGIIGAAINASQNAVAASMDFQEREKQLVWKRLNLEADALQTAQLEAIKTAQTIDEIPGIVQNFQQQIKDNMGGQKYGKEWLDSLGAAYMSANNNDVSKAVAAKEKELLGIKMDETLKQYADTILSADPDKANFIYSDAEALIDASGHMTPEEKKKTKENFKRLAMEGYVDNNPEQASRALDDSNNFKGLSKIERNFYKGKADKMILAREKDKLSMQEKQQKAVKNAADYELNSALYQFLRGQLSAEDAIAIADKYAKTSPKTAMQLQKAVFPNGTEKVKDNEIVLQQLKDKLKDGSVTKEDIIFARFDNMLSKETAKELLSEGKELGLFTDEEDKDENYRENIYLQNGTKADVMQAFVEKKITKATADALYKDIDKRENAETEEWYYQIKNKISSGEDVDIQAEIDNSPVPLLASKKKDELIKAQENIKSKNEKALEEEKKEIDTKLDQIGKDLEKMRNRQNLSLYISYANEIDNAALVDNLPSKEDIRASVDNGDLTEERGNRLIAQYDKKEAALLAKSPKKITEADKISNLNEIEDEYAALTVDPTAENFSALAQKISEMQGAGALPKGDGAFFLSNFWADYDAFTQEQTHTEGDAGQSFFERNAYYRTIQNFLDGDKTFKKTEITKNMSQNDRNIIKSENARRNKYRIQMRGLYNDAVMEEAEKQGIENPTIEAINNSGKKGVIYQNALNTAKLRFAQQQYPNADVQKINPTNILSDDNGLQRVASGAEDNGRGEKLVDNRILKIGKTRDGKYKAMFADGKVKEISEEQYQSYKG